MCYDGLPLQMDVSSYSTILGGRDFDYSITICLVFHVSSTTEFEEICDDKKCSLGYMHSYLFISC
jgi:hypothetical protein